MSLLPKSLFARTALLISSTLLVFAVIAWQAIVWTALVPAAEAQASLLTERAHEAVAAWHSGRALADGMRFETSQPYSGRPPYAGLAMRTYVERVRDRLVVNLAASESHIYRYVAPAEVWLRVPQVADAWLVVTWRIGGPGAPVATLLVWIAAALLALGAAAFSARRLTAPLAELAGAAARLAEGERVEIKNSSGPSEVRALAVAFQSMSDRLAELDEQRELMLGGLSHDLRTPLARLRVAIELLGEGDTALSEEMTANIEEMDRMVGQFLHYTRASYRETPARASLDDIVRQTLAMFASDERVRLELHAAEIRSIPVDSVRHMIQNLVQNALEYGQPPVTIRTGSSGEKVRIAVEDRGLGLSDDEWAQAIKPFHRLRDQPAGSHTGLGLAMVERLVRVCEGTLESRRVAPGFVVTVSLPAPAT